MLPPDVFTPILELAISRDGPSDVDSNFYPFNDVHELLNITSVCRQWREMALTSPSLWKYIPTDLHEDLLVLFVQRSADSLLHIRLTHKVFRDWEPDRRSQELALSKFALLIPHLHRTRFLSLTLSTFTIYKLDTELITSHCDLPALEVLQFHTNGVLTIRPPVAVEEALRESALSLMEKFGMPVIRGLHFTGISIPASSITSNSISYLSLTVNGASSGLRSYLCDVFGRCESLVSLSLNIWRDGILMGFAPPATPSSQILELPHLRRLALKGICNQCLFVSRMLRTPSLREVCLDIGSSSFEGAIQVVPLTTLGNCLSVKADSEEIHMEFTNSCGGTRKGTDFTVIIRGTLPVSYLSSARLVTLLEPRTFPEVEIMDYTTPYIYDKTFLPSLFPRFPNLRSLHIRYTDIKRKFPIDDAFNLKLLVQTVGKRSAASLRNLVLEGFEVIMPTASPFFIELSSIPRWRRSLRLAPFVAEFRNCDGFSDSTLRASGLEREGSSVMMSSDDKARFTT
ncbi:hypothetical protein SCHPADRAFT_257368 [Schizopora paradoxa]|uniref:Uncharacterized protein n=1 Tax=Schizopora paradoxa TaxID=27342 RepID=A0A0H2SEZ0_9AGAM|nr:hypothetical protein SCHPADRAFT_257368 [Schizopora paradoxa]